MRKLFALGSVIAIAAASPAAAITMVEDYTFAGTSGGPVAVHSGSFSVNHDTIADTYTLASFDFGLDGHLFDTSNVSMAEWGHPFYLFGGNVSGINTVNTGVPEPDFFFKVNFSTLTANGFLYSMGDSQFWDGELAVTRVDGAVPEPATWAMMLLGFGLVGGAMRARRSAARVRLTYA